MLAVMAMNLQITTISLMFLQSLAGCSASHGDGSRETHARHQTGDVVSVYDDIYDLNQSFSQRDENKTYYAEKNIYRAGDVSARYVIFHLKEVDHLFVSCLYTRGGKSGLVFAVHSLDENGIIAKPHLYDDLTFKTNDNGDIQITVTSSKLAETISLLQKMLDRDLPVCIDGVFTITLVSSGKRRALINGWDAEAFFCSMQEIEQAYEQMFSNGSDLDIKDGRLIDKRGLRIYEAISNMGTTFDGDKINRKTLPEWLTDQLDNKDQ